ncbi:hypothetical protein ACFXO9_09645 [Nocardia tengchongensis]|uniref:hypothetical protein n=1 Tax=Nocardia tengchongensis TaxID=2055889 RepID=UPI00367BC88D
MGDDNSDNSPGSGWINTYVPNQPWSFEPEKDAVQKKVEDKNYPKNIHDYRSNPDMDPAMKGSTGKVSSEITEKGPGKDLLNRTLYQNSGVNGQGPWSNKFGYAIGGGFETTYGTSGGSYEYGKKVVAGARLQDQLVGTGPFGTSTVANGQVAALLEAGEKLKLSKTQIEASAETFGGAKASADINVKKGGIGLTGGVEGWAGAGGAAKLNLGWNSDTHSFDANASLGAAFGLGGKLSGGVSIDPSKVGHDVVVVGKDVGKKLVDGLEYPSKVIPVGSMVSAANKAATVAAPVVNAVDHPVATIATAANKAATVAAPVVNAVEHPVTTIATAANKAATVAAPVVNAVEHPVTTITTAANKVEKAVEHPSAVVNTVKSKASSALNKMKSLFSEGGEVNIPGISNDLIALRGLGGSYLPSQELLAKVRADSGAMFSGPQRGFDRRVQLRITPANAIGKPSGARSEGSSLLASGLARRS